MYRLASWGDAVFFWMCVGSLIFTVLATVVWPFLIENIMGEDGLKKLWLTALSFYYTLSKDMLLVTCWFYGMMFMMLAGMWFFSWHLSFWFNVGCLILVGIVHILLVAYVLIKWPESRVNAEIEKIGELEQAREDIAFSTRRYNDA